MPRDLKRYYGHGHLHFLTFSCYQRRLLLTPARRNLFLRILEQVRKKYGVTIVGYMVMPEHVHLIVSEPSCKSLDLVLHDLKLRVTKQVRRWRKQTAQGVLWGDEEHFWQARYYDFNVWSARKLREKLNYVHMNPVKRGLVMEPDQWKWSSARYYLYGEMGPVVMNEVVGMPEGSQPLWFPGVNPGHPGHPQCGGTNESQNLGHPARTHDS